MPSATTRITLAPTIRGEDEVGRAAVGERERRPHVRVGDHHRQHDRPEPDIGGGPPVPAVRGNLGELEPIPTGDVDRTVRDPSLPRSRRRSTSARRPRTTPHRTRWGSAFHTASERLCRIVERGGVRLVADRPLLHRLITDVLRPERVCLDEERIGSHRHVPFGHVQQRFAGDRQTSPVPRPPAEQPMTRHQADGRVRRSTRRTTTPRPRRRCAAGRRTA